MEFLHFLSINFWIQYIHFYTLLYAIIETEMLVSECKEKLFVQMKSGDGINVPVEVNNDEEGVYNLEFKPRVAGEHQLIVAIRGQHIDGSPFILPVDGGRDYSKISSSIPFTFGIEGGGDGGFCRPWGKSIFIYS